MSGQSRRGRATLGLVGALLGGLLAVLPGTVVTGSLGRPAEAATARVEVGDLRFSPAKLQISVGDTVEWDAADDGHTVTARDGSFDSSSRGLMGTGDYFRFRFRAPGTFAYYCRVHASRGMQGEIVVVDPSAPTTATTRLTPVSAAATTSTTSAAAAVTTTTAPVTTTSRVLATSSTTSLAQAVATTSPPGLAATPNEAPTMNPDARVVGSPPPEAGGLPEAQAAARHPGGSGPTKGPLIGAAAALLALLALGAFGLKRRRRIS